MLGSAALLLSLYASLHGWRRARRRLKNAGHDQKASRRRGLLQPLLRVPGLILVLLLWLGMLAALPLVISVSLVGAGWHHLPVTVHPFLDADGPPGNILARADLTAAEIAEKPADWLGRDTADRRFRIGWCRNRGLPPDPCHKPVAPVADPTGAD
jgi:hypothetical protein